MVSSKQKFLTLTGCLFLLSWNVPVVPDLIQTTGENESLCKGIKWLQNENGSVVINEIMADPTPVVGFPDAEWIELLNISEEMINLLGWKLVVGSVSRILPAFSLSPGQYVTLCSDMAVPELKKWGQVISFPVFPALRNSGNRIELFNTNGTPVDAVVYSDSWYHDKVKKNGGWSLEKIDPERNCHPEANWISSADSRGATPGSVNSVFHTNKDDSAPLVIAANCVSPREIRVIFSEPMDTLLLENPSSYSLSEGQEYPGKVILHSDSAAILQWNNPFPENRSMFLRFFSLKDLCGNSLETAVTEVQWTTLQPGDVIINEILFDPRPGCVDFVEIWNFSQKKIETSRLVLASRDDAGSLKRMVNFKTGNDMLSPGDYAAFTSDTGAVLRHYFTPCRKCLRQVASLPAFNNDKGCVVLLYDSATVMDEFRYDEKMHHPLLYDKEGVSLERVNPEMASDNPKNWLSASSLSGYATPGYRNSQYGQQVTPRWAVTCGQPAFSPNGDGHNDELVIGYETESPGWMANCWLFDTRGRMVFQLMNNTMLDFSGTIRWNGRDGAGSRLSAGPYVLLLEMFSLEGKTRRFKKAVVLTYRGE